MKKWFATASGSDFQEGELYRVMLYVCGAMSFENDARASNRVIFQSMKQAKKALFRRWKQPNDEHKSLHGVRQVYHDESISEIHTGENGLLDFASTLRNSVLTDRCSLADNCSRSLLELSMSELR